MKTKKVRWPYIFSLILLIAAIIMAGIETKQILETKVNWEPTEVYPMANQHISWD